MRMPHGLGIRLRLLVFMVFQCHFKPGSAFLRRDEVGTIRRNSVIKRVRWWCHTGASGSSITAVVKHLRHAISSSRPLMRGRE